MPNNKLNISEMSDADFLSFLYSERDRENSLSQYQGWNTWALVGAIATIICALYSILKTSAEEMCFSNVLYYSSIVFAVVLSYRSFALLFIRPRGIDYSKIKTIKDAVPIFYLVFVIICSTAFVLVFAIMGSWNTVAWLWSVVLFAYIVSGVAIIINRNRIVPSYYDPCLFPNRYVDLVFNLIVVWVLSFVLSRSIGRIQQIGFGPDLEFAVCFSILLWLVYFLIKANVGNRPVKEFDVIIDDYIYKGESKEHTYNRILINRMGLGVMEACKKEVEVIQKDLDSFSPKMDLIKHYRTELDSESIEFDKLKTIVADTNSVLDYLSSNQKHFHGLSDKVGQMLDMVPAFENIPEFKSLMSVLNDVEDHVDQLLEGTSEVITKAKQHMQPFYCNKTGSYCPQIVCEHRNDPRSLGYSIKMWFYGRLKS